MAQIKILGSDKSQMNHSYWSQQNDIPPPGSTTQHPTAVQKAVSDKRRQQLRIA